MSDSSTKTKPMTLTEKIAIVRSVQGADLTAVEKLVAMTIALELNERGIYSGSHATIARMCSIAKSSVSRSVASLRDKYPESFKVRNVGRNSSNDYKVLPFPIPTPTQRDPEWDEWEGFSQGEGSSHV